MSEASEQYQPPEPRKRWCMVCRKWCDHTKRNCPRDALETETG